MNVNKGDFNFLRIFEESSEAKFGALDGVCRGPQPSRPRSIETQDKFRSPSLVQAWLFDTLPRVPTNKHFCLDRLRLTYPLTNGSLRPSHDGDKGP